MNLDLNKLFTLIRNYIDNKFTNSIGTTNSSLRDEWIKSELLNFKNGLKILDAGAGEAKYKKYCSHLDYVAQDIAVYQGTGNKEGLQTGDRDYSNLDIISDIYNIPVEDKSFDIVLCTEVIEHIVDPVKVFSELNRILKNDGILIITAPFNSLTHYAPFHYSTGFSRYFYEFHLPLNGFQILLLEPNGNYFEYLAQELRRIKSISQKYSNQEISILGKIFIKAVLNLLKKSLATDSGSDELLCYGYHVKCRKVKSI